MTERPILFSAPMVRALLAGTKTQTRRALKTPVSVTGFTHWDGAIWDRMQNGQRGDSINCPYGQPGDRLWVRETYFAWGRWETRFSAKKGRDEWHFIDMTVEFGHEYAYPADGRSIAPYRRTSSATPNWWKRPAIFMPRAASRITLEVTGVRVERLQDISEADAIAEGIDKNEANRTLLLVGQKVISGPVAEYSALWESINGGGSWDDNQWVWVIEFRRVEGGAT